MPLSPCPSVDAVLPSNTIEKLKEVVQRFRHDVRLELMGNWAWQSDGSIWSRHRPLQRVSSDLAYIKGKGAGDLLITLGLVSDAIAFDTRIINILKELGASIPDNLVSSPAAYRMLEQELLNRVCRPLDL